MECGSGPSGDTVCGEADCDSTPLSRDGSQTSHKAGPEHRAGWVEGDWRMGPEAMDQSKGARNQARSRT